MKKVYLFALAIAAMGMVACSSEKKADDSAKDATEQNDANENTEESSYDESEDTDYSDDMSGFDSMSSDKTLIGSVTPAQTDVEGALNGYVKVTDDPVSFYFKEDAWGKRLIFEPTFEVLQKKDINSEAYVGIEGEFFDENGEPVNFGGRRGNVLTSFSSTFLIDALKSGGKCTDCSVIAILEDDENIDEEMLKKIKTYKITTSVVE